VSITESRTALDVCALDRLTPELGAAILVGDEQIAIFRLADDRVFAVQNLDPFSGASVMSRGITGSRGDEPTIASPIFKQVFSLVTGACLVTMDKEPKAGLAPHLVTYPVSVDNGRVIVHLAGTA
jgi:nitrite reductase (NADH) small subunit